MFFVRVIVYRDFLQKESEKRAIQTVIKIISKLVRKRRRVLSL